MITLGYFQSSVLSRTRSHANSGGDTEENGEHTNSPNHNHNHNHNHNTLTVVGHGNNVNTPVAGGGGGGGGGGESPVSRQRRENNLAAVLMGISILFVFCQSAKIIPDVHEVIYCRILDEDEEEGAASTGSDECGSGFMEGVVALSHLLLAVNSSANFIIYTWRGE